MMLGNKGIQLMYDKVRFATPLHSAFCFPLPPLWFSIFDKLVAEKYINGFENSGIYKEPYLAKVELLKKSKALIMFTTNENLSQ